MSAGLQDWVILFRSRSNKECRDHALVLQAVGIACEVGRVGDEFIIAVPAFEAERARKELEAYTAETPTPPARPEPPVTGDGWLGVLYFGTLILLVSVLAQWRASGLDWFSAGKTHAALIRRGEVWRAVTALTLHVDLAHLFANLVIGSVAAFFAAQTLGAGLALLCMLLGGALGNLINALVRSPDHTSVGASTAVFAAFGTLAAHAWWRRRAEPTGRLERWAPLIGGVLLLSFLGTGGGRTDVPAHIFGFAGGAVAGALCARFEGLLSTSPRAQPLLGLAGFLVLSTSWLAALFKER